jgi:hypothetical protein
MFEKIKEVWNLYGFEILVGISIFIIIITAILRRNKKGTWSSNYIYNKKSNSKASPPKESKGELECRKVLQELFKKPFGKDRPNFLNNPVTGGNFNLELDCYCPELRLAVEYNGVQHYKYIPYFHKNQEAFTNQKYRDYMKRTMCKDNNVSLIEVPYTVKVPDIKNYLIKELEKKGFIR